MANSRMGFTSTTSCRVTVNGAEHTSESSMTAVFRLPQALSPDQLRAMREAMKRAGIDFEWWDNQPEGCTFGFSARSRTAGR